MLLQPIRKKLETIRVLLVDDDEDDYMITRELFDEIQDAKQYHLDWIDNYDDAMELLREQSHHIYLLDYRLGHQNGLDLIKSAIDEGISGPFILLTGQGATEVDLMAMELGVCDYLIKSEITASLLERSVRYSVERHNTMKRLKQSESRYRNLFELSPDSIVISTIENGQILDFNDSFSHLLGYSRDEILQKTALELNIWMKSDDRDFFVRTLKEQGFINNYQLEHLAKDGETKHVIVSAEIINFNNEKYILSIIRDITDRVVIETERENLISELDAFTHTVAHDLKNPLTVLTGYAQLMDASLNDKKFIDDKLEEFITVVHDQGIKMSNIIDELLRFASFERSKQIEYSVIQMDKIICEVQERLAWMIRQSEAQIAFPDKWHTAVGYGPWIEEVWANYISNAIKYGGSPPIIKLGSDKLDNGYIRYWVRDNGRGLNIEEQSKLFEEFSRLKFGVDGHGLGLSIVKRIVERLGGTVGVESSINEGSLFYFTLPSND